MKSLDEAIKHAEEVYEEQMCNAKAVKAHHGEFVPGYLTHCKCAEEHKQLAEWLKELKSYREKYL